MIEHVLGLDIGGANLKVGHTQGKGRTVAFALWRNPGGLVEKLKEAIRGAPPYDLIAVTMTGELCDCFRSKREGVLAILEAVARVANGVPIQVWTNEGQFVDWTQARAQPHAVASANWLALASYVGRYVPKGPALLVDMGSTTTDIIPLLEGRPIPRGRTDPERLLHGELYYLGWKRTPLCALASGHYAAEFFATMHDVYLTLAGLPEDPLDCDTPDGQPVTRKAALQRLARMVCGDVETLGEEACRDIAREMHRLFMNRAVLAINAVVHQMPTPPQRWIMAGSGEFLTPQFRQHPLLDETLQHCEILSLADIMGDIVGSIAACAISVAVLALERA